MSDDYVIRPADWTQRGERSFVIKTWLACDRATPQARAEGPSYLQKQAARIEALLDNPRVLTLMAVNSFDGKLDGFSVREGPGVLWYVYVRLAAQRVGLAKRLCYALDPSVVYHHTPVNHDVRIPLGWRFEPHLRRKTPPPDTIAKVPA